MEPSHTLGSQKPRLAQAPEAVEHLARDRLGVAVDDGISELEGVHHEGTKSQSEIVSAVMSCVFVRWKLGTLQEGTSNNCLE